jgi:hypothetical protein
MVIADERGQMNARGIAKKLSELLITMVEINSQENGNVMKRILRSGFLILFFMSVAVPAMATLTTFDTSSSGVYYAINDGGFYVNPTGFSTTNASSAISGSNFHIQAAASAGDVGIVLYYNGGLTLGDLQSVSIKTVGSTPLNLNLWLDTGGDGKFFSFNGNELTSLNGDSYAGAGPQTSIYDSASPFYMLGGNGAGGTYTLAQLQGGSVSGIGPNTLTALWVGSNAPISADISSVAVDTAPTPIPAAAYLFGSGLLALAGIRKKMQK